VATRWASCLSAPSPRVCVYACDAGASDSVSLFEYVCVCVCAFSYARVCEQCFGDKVMFNAGATFMVSRDRVLANSLEFYKNILAAVNQVRGSTEVHCACASPFPFAWPMSSAAGVTLLCPRPRGTRTHARTRVVVCACQPGTVCTGPRRDPHGAPQRQPGIPTVSVLS
jgi:hypothetical protein